MTFSIIGYCPETGAVGGAICTSNMAVGARCIRLAHDCGAFLSQHRTDPRLGDQGLAALKDGATAGEAVEVVVAGTANIGWRQLAALDRHGNWAAFHGQDIYSVYNHSAGANCLAVGNILANDQVTVAMRDAFVAAGSEPLLERLMRALEAGRDAGGEIHLPLLSAALRVTDDDDLDRCDIRVDFADDPIGALRKIKDEYTKSDVSFRKLTLDPGSVPISPEQKAKSIARISKLGWRERMPISQKVITGDLRSP